MHLITPVGTSLFDNYEDHGPDGQTVRRCRTEIKNEPGDRWNDRSGQIDAIREDRGLSTWIKTSNDASAELESAAKVADRHDEPVTIHLLASDTVESRLAAELMAKNAEIDGVEVVFNDENDQITDLQVFDDDAFRDGIRNLVRRVKKILEKRGELMGHLSGGTCAINITGGYKATVPYLTILGELYDVPLHYKFRDADGLLSIPQVPITIDESLFREHEAEFAALDRGVGDWNAFEDEHHTFAKQADDLITTGDNVAILSPLGELFWGYYTDQFHFFYAPDDVYGAIQEQPNVQAILRSTKFDQLRREEQVEMKGGHRVFDDGDNSNRIYCFVEDETLYIYQTFGQGEHDDHEDYYEGTTFDEDFRRNVIRRARRRRLERAA